MHRSKIRKVTKAQFNEFFNAGGNDGGLENDIINKMDKPLSIIRDK